MRLCNTGVDVILTSRTKRCHSNISAHTDDKLICELSMANPCFGVILTPIQYHQIRTN
jgi:hypothetical protein